VRQDYNKSHIRRRTITKPHSPENSCKALFASTQWQSFAQQPTTAKPYPLMYNSETVSANVQQRNRARRFTTALPHAAAHKNRPNLIGLYPGYFVNI
jgi:hypothetical protein